MSTNDTKLKADILNLFYIMPLTIFNSYQSGISLVEGVKRQRRPPSYPYREAWHLLKEHTSQNTLQML